MPLDRVPAQPFGGFADRPRRRRRRSFVLFALLFGRHSPSVFSSTDAVESGPAGASVNTPTRGTSSSFTQLEGSTHEEAQLTTIWRHDRGGLDEAFNLAVSSILAERAVWNEHVSVGRPSGRNRSA